MVATYRYSPLKTGGSYQVYVYSAPSTLYPQVIYVIVFSAGLNGFHVDQVDRENDKANFSLHSYQPILHALSIEGVVRLFMYVPC